VQSATRETGTNEAENECRNARQILIRGRKRIPWFWREEAHNEAGYVPASLIHIPSDSIIHLIFNRNDQQAFPSLVLQNSLHEWERRG
jgi:hypothetical protein